MINKVILIGHLGADPELKNISAETVVCKANLATTERFKDKSGETKEETQWHTLELWGKPAETFAKYTKTGSRVYVEGKIIHDKYEKDGETKFFTKIRVQSFTFLDSKSDNNDSISSQSNGGDDGLPF